MGYGPIQIKNSVPSGVSVEPSNRSHFLSSSIGPPRAACYSTSRNLYHKFSFSVIEYVLGTGVCRVAELLEIPDAECGIGSGRSAGPLHAHNPAFHGRGGCAERKSAGVAGEAPIADVAQAIASASSWRERALRRSDVRRSGVREARQAASGRPRRHTVEQVIEAQKHI